jgi:DNA transformation protein and related proteins
MPERLYDDAEELAQWSREALGAAQRAASGGAPRGTAKGKKRKR